MRGDPRRDPIWRELHARPYVRFAGPAHVFHFAFLTGVRTQEEDRAHLERLKGTLGLAATYDAARHVILTVALPRLGRVVVAWERHTEFTAYTFFLYELEVPFDPFGFDPQAFLPADFFQSLGLHPLVAVFVSVWGRADMPDTPERLAQLFEGHTVNGSRVMDGRAEAWSAYRVHDDGFGRIALITEPVSPHSLGRTVERLLTLENLYHLILLSVPLARAVRGDLVTWESRVIHEMEALRVAGTLQQKRSVLETLLGLSTEVEAARARVSSQFAASAAYFSILEDRFSDLRETKIEHALRLSRFVMRRLAPAAQTCRSVVERLTHLSHRIDRTAHLLRTSISLHVEEQNQRLLASADRRARLQLELQRVVESLSVVAIAYYLVALMAYALRGAGRLGLHVDADLALGVSAPVMLVAAWMVMRLVRKRIER